MEETKIPAFIEAQRNQNVEDALENEEAGTGTIKDNMDDLRDILEEEINNIVSSEEVKLSQRRKILRSIPLEN